MSRNNPRADRLADALDLLVHNGEDETGRIRARITSLVAAVAADAQALVERHRADGSDAVDASWISMHVRELSLAQTELADRRERLRELKSVIDFAARIATDKGSRS